MKCIEDKYLLVRKFCRFKEIDDAKDSFGLKSYSLKILNEHFNGIMAGC